MALKIGKAELKRRAELADEMGRLADGIVDAVSLLNKEVHDRVESVNGAIAAYNAVLLEAETFAAEQGDNLRSTIDDKSERWKESDVGQAADSMAGEWENAELDALEPVTLPHVDVTDDVLAGGLWPHERLNELPEEADQ